jgi:hypothetical protein
MNQVISIRVPEQTRSEMKKLRPFINWNQKIRDFIQKRVDDKKRMMFSHQLQNASKKIRHCLPVLLQNS